MNLELIVEIIGFIILPIIGCCFAFYWKQINDLHKRCDTAEDDLNALRLHVAEQYLNKNEFKDAIGDLKASINLLFVKIDKIIDRREKTS